MDRRLRDITLFDLELLAELGKHPSLRSLGRAKGLEAPHLSKLLRRLEERLGARVVNRSPKGFHLTPEGLHLGGLARELLVQAARLEGERSPAVAAPPTVSIASTRFISAHLVAPVLPLLRERGRKERFRLLDMAPEQVASAGVLAACDVVVSVGEPPLTPAWNCERVADLEWGLFAHRSHPLSAKASEGEVKAFPFVVPTYWSGNTFESGNDYCPLPWSARLKGDECSSVLTAVELVKGSPGQLVFAPLLVLREAARRGEVKRISVKDWAPTRQPVFLAVRAGSIKRPLAVALRTQIQRFVQA